METPVTALTRPWLRFYPKGVPHEINADKYTSLATLMEEGFQRFADRPAYACLGKQITF
ncbi:MAG: long-chain-fatty-acid--CoA ligase, partial [Hymenobacter sp.]